MASQTQTRVVVRETRALDHLYDPVATTSGAVNHNRMTAKAMATELKKVPEEIFSELVHYPRASWRPVEKGQIPTNVGGRWLVRGGFFCVNWLNFGIWLVRLH